MPPGLRLTDPTRRLRETKLKLMLYLLCHSTAYAVRISLRRAFRNLVEHAPHEFEATPDSGRRASSLSILQSGRRRLNRLRSTGQGQKGRRVVEPICGRGLTRRGGLVLGRWRSNEIASEQVYPPPGGEAAELSKGRGFRRIAWHPTKRCSWRGRRQRSSTIYRINSGEKPGEGGGVCFGGQGGATDRKRGYVPSRVKRR